MTASELVPMAPPRAERDAPSQPLVATLLPFPLSYPGGVSTYVAGLSSAINQSGQARTCLIAPDSVQAGPGDRLSQLRLAARQFFSLWRLGPDTVHTHEHPALLASALLYQFVSRRPVRVVHTVHIEPATHWVSWKRRLMGYMLGRCSAVTAVSEHTAQRLGRIAEPAPAGVRVIYGGADVKLRHATDPEVGAFRVTYGIEDDDGPLVCQISPLNFPRKVEGVRRLIEAFVTVRRAFPRARLLVVGNGDLRESVESVRTRFGLEDAVVLTGYLEDVSLPMTLADVYCHITLQDECPLSLLEAMRAGKPIVASAMGGIPELLSDEKDGVLVSTEPPGIAAAIVDLLRDSGRAQRLGAEAARVSSRHFTWQRAASEFAPLYRHGGGQPVIQRLQEQVYGARADYRRGSPHLSHPGLQDRLLDCLQSSLASLSTRGFPREVLEVGAGHGGFTLPMLAWGYAVTATEMSRPSVQRLEAQFGRNPHFKVAFDPDGSLSMLGSTRYSAIACISVLHHIPDYVTVVRAAIANHLEPGGTLVTFQDPTWYPRQSRRARAADRIAYFAWRLFQGRYAEGLQTRWRRFSGVYDPALSADMVEYHVVRRGVDEQVLVNALAPGFETLRLFSYWSTNSGLWQWIGERLGLVNTFGLVATGYRGTFEPGPDRGSMGVTW